MNARFEKLGLSGAALRRIAGKEPKQATVDNEVWDMVDLCREALGDEEFIMALLKAMSTEEARENLEFIIQTYDLRSDPEEY